MADACRAPGLIQRYREELQVRHYARRTVNTYEQWLRVKDLDFQRRELMVRDGKGGKDRLTMLPQSLVPELQDHLLKVRHLHQGDLRAGWGRVLMPYALARKYPNADREWAWQWLFPQQNRWHDRAPGI